MSRRRFQRQAGFTLLEVMMALTVLAIGMLGVVALQASTIGSTQDAQMFTVANSVARTWVQRLQRDAARWNHPSTYSATDDIGDTVWLKKVGATPTPQWFRPGKPGVTDPIEPGASAAFDLYGRDVKMDDPDNSIYCTHLRLRRLYPDLIRAEVRVFWKKRRMANYARYDGHKMTSGLCSSDGNEETIGQDTDNFHWTYMVTAIGMARAQ